MENRIEIFIWKLAKMTDSKTRSNKMNETCSRFSGIQVRQSDCCTICSIIATWYGLVSHLYGTGRRSDPY